MDLRPYDPERDREALWSLKEAFELELGNGAADKRAAYADKLTDAYQEQIGRASCRERVSSPV